jgi:LmbE family N-acetylglucosaminyl deacetylase
MPVRGWLAEEYAQQSGIGKPDISIDVTDFLKIKYAAYDKHVSQNGGFGRDYVLSNRKKPYDDGIEEFITVIDNTK